MDRVSIFYNVCQGLCHAQAPLIVHAELLRVDITQHSRQLGFEKAHLVVHAELVRDGISLEVFG
jgi:hypothetical protein